MKLYHRITKGISRRYLSFCERWPRAAYWFGFARKRRRPFKAIFLLIAHFLGFIFSVEAVMQTRTEQGAVAWAISLNTMPVLAVPGWLIFGDNKVNQYHSTREVGIAEVRPVADKLITDLSNYAVKESDAEAGDFEVLERLGKIGSLPAVRGNVATLLIDGDETFEAILAGIAEARRYVLLQYYIYRDDEIGKRVRDALVERAKAGVKVYVLLDNYGSLLLSDEFLASMTDAGVEVRYIMDVKGKANRFQLNFRNHRKIVIVDGKQGFLGGFNVGDEYLGLDEELSPWRDTHMEWRGPIVKCLQIPFTEDWRWSGGKLLDTLDWEVSDIDAVGEMEALCLASGPADPLETCPLGFLTLINSAKSRLWLASPYFVPDDKTVTALQLAALRGVDVRILLPELYDSRLVYLSSFSYLGELERTGVKFYRYQEGFLHQKVMLIDDSLSVIGSANLDNRSFRLNFEVSGIVSNTGFADEVEKMLEADFARSIKTDSGALNDKSFFFRLSVRLARMMAPIQ